MFRRIATILLTLGVVIMCASCRKDETYAQLEGPKDGDIIATIKTSMGDITVKLFPEYAPQTVQNFTTHAENGYYDGVIFHRVINDFMIQGGDPTGTGSGGESIWGGTFEDEVTVELHNIRGALSMANYNDPQTNRYNTNGSQFFIVQNTGIPDDYKELFNSAIKDPSFTTSVNSFSPYKVTDRIPVAFLKYYVENGGVPMLDYPGLSFGYKHTVFGQVIEGMDIVDKIAAVETNDNDRPLEDVVIITIEISEYKK